MQKIEAPFVYKKIVSNDTGKFFTKEMLRKMILKNPSCNAFVAEGMFSLWRSK